MTSQGGPPDDPGGLRTPQDIVDKQQKARGRGLVLQRGGYRCVNFSEDEVQEGKALQSWEKLMLCVL